MLKVKIWPSFIPQSVFELKPENTNWLIILTKDAYPHFADSGGIWIEKTDQSEAVQQLMELANTIKTNPTSDDRVILDGVSVQLLYQNATIEFRNPFKNSKEHEFIHLLFQITKNTISHPDCGDYLELVEPYFFEVSPIKLFEDTPYRVKLIGGISTHYEKELKEQFERLTTQPFPILDLSNFHFVGRALDPYFKSIEQHEGLTVYTNQQARNYLKEIHFDFKKVKHGRPATY